ncbi:MAG: diphosphate--fructose-6-phosphate 1-phosphotransferase, partial [Proteobacteria bacterium]|nr:diphosphate--fructose-6-phosphate 1-phosphotransferase [Pseudomonadota bacterium]
VALARVANVEKKMPRRFISRSGFGVTAAALEYLRPLIQGEDYPPFKAGMPQYVRLKNLLIEPRLPAFEPE